MPVINGFRPKDFVLPINKSLAGVKITSDFSQHRYHPVLKKFRSHQGVDIGAPMGTQITAPYFGTVVFSGWRNGYGNTVLVYHGQNAYGKHVYTLYGHMSAIDVANGQDVNPGTNIGKVGMTGGVSSGPHLHYEVRELDNAAYAVAAGNAAITALTKPGALNPLTGRAATDPILATEPRPGAIPVANWQDAYIEGGEAPIRKGGAKGGETDDEALSASLADEITQISSELINYPSALSSQVVATLGSSLASYLFKGNAFAQVTGSAVFQSVGQNILQAAAQGGFNSNFTRTLSDGTTLEISYNVLDDFGQELVSNLRSAALGAVSSFLAMELGHALGVQGFGGELLTQGASSVLGQVLGNAAAITQGGTAAANIGGNLFFGLDAKGLFGNSIDPTNLGAWNPGLLSSAVGSFLGAKLGSLILSPTNTQGAILSSVGSAVGAWAFGAGAAATGAIGSIGASIASAFGSIGNVAAPLVGSLVGFLLGSLIGRLFGRKKPRVPTASAETYLDLGSGQWMLGAASSANQGNLRLAMQMAESSKDTINEVVKTIVGGNDTAHLTNTVQQVQRYGHTGSTVYFDQNYSYGWVRQYSGSDPSAAVETGALAGIRSTRIAGGDIFVKRAIYSSTATTLAGLFGDIMSASDYRRYAENRQLINQMMISQPNSAFAATWVVALSQVAENGISRFHESDFFGGMDGFLDSLGIDLRMGEVHPEDLDFRWEGGPVRIAAKYQRVDQSVSGVEGRPAQIYRLYDMSLGRAPDPYEVAEWLRYMDMYGDIYAIGGLIIQDATVAARLGGSDDDFITKMYQYSLHRNPNQNEILNWRPVVTAQGRGWVLAWFSEYAEHRNFTDPTIAQGFNYKEFIGQDLFALLPTVSADGRSVQIPDLAEIGYRPAHGNISSSMNDAHDWLYAGSGLYIDAQEGDDIVFASNYNDVIAGAAGYDWLDGRDGDDVINGGDQDDVISGGQGVDLLVGGPGNDYISGGAGHDFVQEPWNSPAPPGGLYGEDGDDTLVGGDGLDTLYGGDGNDVLIVDQDGGGTYDWLDGGAGLDLVSFERFNTAVAVDMWTNVFPWAQTSLYGDGWTAVEGIIGTEGNDALYGHDGDTTIKGLGGDDDIAGRPGNDIIEGGAGADKIVGDAGSDVASYEGSPEGVFVSLLTGQAYGGDADGDYFNSIENLRGSKFADELTGDGGGNTLSGLRGDDRFVMTAGTDVVHGDDGIDELDASLSTTPVYINSGYGLATNYSAYTYFDSIESFIGTAGNDEIYGDGRDEIFDGGAGADVLSGGDGTDSYLFGRGSGQDSVSETYSGANAILLKDTINWRDVLIYGADLGNPYGNLQVSIRGTSDTITVGSNFLYGSNGAHNHMIKTLTLGGVSTIDIGLIDYTPYADDPAGTSVYGVQNRSDVIFAGGGDDTIYSSGASYGYEISGNIVYAGDGNDTIYGNAGDDQYIFERGNGADTLINAVGQDTVVMGPSVSPDDVIYEVSSAGDLYIGLRDPNNGALTASQVSDRMMILGGGSRWVGMYYGAETFDTIEYVRVGGQEVDLKQANINWITNYYDDGGGWPVALDLDGDGIELRSVNGSRVTTVGADGTVRRIGWLGQDDGFLALDRDASGSIDRLSEISFINDLDGAKSDLDGLRAYDSNGNNQLDSGDKRWGEFRVWQDKNQDGFGSSGELVTLDVAGVASISLAGKATGFTRADGLDNTVLATADVAWSDAKRTGGAYDVVLATLQVRTDGGDKRLTDASNLARGAESDIESMLWGVQALTGEQVASIKNRKTETASRDDAKLYRIESLVGLGGAVAKDGLFTVDASKAATQVAAQRMSGGDAFADSAWSRAGSIKIGPAEERTADAAFVPARVSDQQKVVLEEAVAFNAARKLADEEKAAALLASDAASRGDAAPRMPTPKEIERATKNDTFHLITETDNGALEGVSGSPVRTASFDIPSDTVDSTDPDADTDVSGSGSTDNSLGSQLDALNASNYRAFSQLDDLIQDNGETDDTYNVVVRSANARLVEVLASLGGTSAMITNYRGMNVGNTAQAEWLSIDAMPSVDKITAAA